MLPAECSPTFHPLTVRITACALAVLLATAPYAPAADTAPLKEARQALAESIPLVAIEKLRTFLSQPDVSAEQRTEAVRNLGEAWLAAGQPAEALAAIQPLQEGGDPAARQLHAEALVALGRWTEALDAFRELALHEEVRIAARLGEAECLQALGRSAEALEVIEQLVANGEAPVAARLRQVSLAIELRDSNKARALLANIEANAPAEKKWRDYSEGRLLLIEGHAEPALRRFKSVLRTSEHLTDNLLVGATLGTAEAALVLHGYEVAHKILEEFLSNHAESSYLELVFRRLDQMHLLDPRPEENLLHQLAARPEARRAALARFYASRLQIRKKKYEKAEENLGKFLELHPEHPLLPHAQLMLADLYLADGRNAEALAALEAAARRATTEDLRGEIELRTALVQFRQGEYLLAANVFKIAGERSPRLRESAIFDAALSALYQRNFDRFIEEYRAFSEAFPASPLRSELILEQGLLQGRIGDPRTAETLKTFLEHFPRHARAAEAHLALAELTFQEGDLHRASRYLRVANVSTPGPEIRGHAQYLAIFLAASEVPRDDEKVIGLAQEFIREQEASPLLPEVRMKLGEIFFHKGNFAEAELQFTAIARENASGALAETALFLAGQSAMQQINPGAVDRSLELFDQVVRMDGRLKLYARQQQAIVQSRLEKESEAITLYEVILTAQPPPEPELRYAALCGKGDNLLALGRKDPQQLPGAIKAFNALATIPEAPTLWRNQALYKKAGALMALDRIPEALVAYYDVLNVDDAQEREFFWYYKAGFEAARIFETEAAKGGAGAQEKWKSAIGIYQKMVQLDGPRSAEAQERKRRLQLEHFIPWE